MENKWNRWCWFFVVAIILEAFIFYVSFVNSDRPNALGYVSFAGTLVSIVLAIVAIIYSFVQTYMQKVDSSSMSVQIDKLTNVVRESEKAAKFVDDIRSVTEKLEKSIEPKILEVCGDVSSIKEYQKMVYERIVGGTSEEASHHPLEGQRGEPIEAFSVEKMFDVMPDHQKLFFGFLYKKRNDVATLFDRVNDYVAYIEANELLPGAFTIGKDRAYKLAVWSMYSMLSTYLGRLGVISLHEDAKTASKVSFSAAASAYWVQMEESKFVDSRFYQHYQLIEE